MQRSDLAPSVLEIDISQLRKNLQYLRSLTSAGAQQMAVIKADAYGHGANRVASAIQDMVDGFVVAHLQEAIALRKYGIEKPIQVLAAPELQWKGLYTDYTLQATVSDINHFEYLAEGTEYHLQFDTGMSRLGILPEHLPEAKLKMESNSNLRCVGIMSHLATADDPDSEKAKMQIELFNSLLAQLPADIPAHLANSGGTLFYPQSRHQIIRNGIAMYGYPPGEKDVEGIKPIINWKTNVVQVRPISEGKTVSYGATWRAPEDGYIITLSAGYADGVVRALSGSIEVFIDGKSVPQVGTITMDYIMCFVKHNPPEVETEAVLLAPDGPTARDWADKLGTISYEIVSGIGNRVERRYIHGNNSLK